MLGLEKAVKFEIKMGVLERKLTGIIENTRCEELKNQVFDEYVYSRGMTDWLYSDSKGKIVPIKKKEYNKYHNTDYVFLASTISGNIVTDSIDRVARLILSNEERAKHEQHREVGKIR